MNDREYWKCSGDGGSSIQLQAKRGMETPGIRDLDYLKFVIGYLGDQYPGVVSGSDVYVFCPDFRVRIHAS